MNWPRSLFLSVTLLSLGAAETPGVACGDIGAGVRLPGDPCASQAVTQERDLSFSIRPARPRLKPRPATTRRPIALGDGVKADAAIFVGPAAQGKEVSDANRR